MIRYLIFDLDNTLYPAARAMDNGISYRMFRYVADYLHVSYEQAVELRRQNLSGYGTTLEWLQRAKGFSDIEGFFAAVHPESEIDELETDPALRPLLESISLPKVILTNAPVEHAERVLSVLNIRDQFSGIVDIRANGLRGKPYEHAYRNALALNGSTVADTLFLDDFKKYTDGYVRLGGTAVLVDQNNPVPEKNEYKGNTLSIKSVYELPVVLETLNS